MKLRVAHKVGNKCLAAAFGERDWPRDSTRLASAARLHKARLTMLRNMMKQHPELDWTVT